MLVISRKKEESLFIGDDIEIKIVKIEDNCVKLAIEAPRELKILRKELIQDISSQNKKSISSNMIDVISKIDNLK
ncbi:carbon storage regulator CsrA [Candidatus Arthromitus sp. SFB-rat-Yit]|uniref:carbon storage regulator CsrA n=1 Tax=Candidatus Arthromitus sp. SFB-rat-Yit TaxID=1041504 RepID=UPI000227A5D8|nr:carbon storage regulator CsrA [Candidatus Arthromitus sp. SFB-rat-Yit]BAK81042.1 carbon storage regulator, CsrA [Candidatus Arthromitus sp. SFB-rat-Yit]